MALQYNANITNATKAKEQNNQPNIKDTRTRQSLKAEVPNNTIGAGQVIAQGAEQNNNTSPAVMHQHSIRDTQAEQASRGEVVKDTMYATKDAALVTTRAEEASHAVKGQLGIEGTHGHFPRKNTHTIN